MRDYRELVERLKRRALHTRHALSRLSRGLSKTELHYRKIAIFHAMLHALTREMENELFDHMTEECDFITDDVVFRLGMVWMPYDEFLELVSDKPPGKPPVTQVVTPPNTAQMDELRKKLLKALGGEPRPGSDIKRIK